jgi:hypothetical protein
MAIGEVLADFRSGNSSRKKGIELRIALRPHMGIYRPGIIPSVDDQLKSPPSHTGLVSMGGGLTNRLITETDVQWFWSLLQYWPKDRDNLSELQA